MRPLPEELQCAENAWRDLVLREKGEEIFFRLEFLPSGGGGVELVVRHDILQHIGHQNVGRFQSLILVFILVVHALQLLSGQISLHV